MSKIHVEAKTEILSYDGTPIINENRIAASEIANLLKTVNDMKGIKKIIEGMEKQSTDSEGLTIKDVVFLALNSATVPGTNKGIMMKAYRISKQFHDNPIVKLTQKDAKFIMDRVSKAYNALVVGRVAEMLGQDIEEVEEKEETPPTE